MYELSIVMEEMRRGCPLLMMVVSPPSTARSSASSAPTTRRSGGCPASPTVRSRWRSPSPSPTRVRTRTASPPPRAATAATGSSRARRCSSPASTRRRRCSSSAAPSRTEWPSPTTRPALFIVPTDTPGFTWTKIDMELVSPESQFQVFLDDVRLPSDALVGSEDAAIAQLFAGLNPSGSWERPARSAWAGWRSTGPSPTSRQDQLATPIGCAPGSSHRWRRTTSRSSWPS